MAPQGWLIAFRRPSDAAACYAALACVTRPCGADSDARLGVIENRRITGSATQTPHIPEQSFLMSFHIACIVNCFSPGLHKGFG